MLVSWDNLMTVLTHHGVNYNFLETFERTTNKEKVAVCVGNPFIRKCLVQWLDSSEFDDSLKSSTKSQKIRLEANQEFKKDRLNICLKLYTKAAQFAPYQSLELALALANRSAVYMRLNQFHECLKDIDTSLKVFEVCNKELLVKDQIIVKLLKRKIESLMALKQNEKARSSWEKLLVLTKKCDKTSLEDEFINKCNILTDPKINNSTKIESSKNASVAFQPKICTENEVYKILKKNKITLPFKSPKLKLCYTEAKGNHFVASEKIDYGEILIFENPFAFVLLPDYYDSFCYNCCMKLNNYSVPCNYCSTILFCDEKCRQESWDTYHHLECKQGTSIFKCIGIAHLALRLTLGTLHSNCKNKDKKDSICNLLTHMDDIQTIELYQYSLTAALLLLYLEQKTDIFKKNPLLDPIAVGNELLQHMARLVCNGNAISTHLMSQDNSETPVLNEESQPRIGTAIYPTSSLLNHSCDPNVFSSNILKFVVIKASRNIKKGEEVTNCYGPNFRRMRFVSRQESLKAQYHFNCKCCVCSDPLKYNKLIQQIDGLVCLSCNNEIESVVDDLVNNETVTCSKCSALLKTSDYTSRMLEANKCYSEGIKHLENNKISIATVIIMECIKLYSQILNKKNSIIMKCEDSLAKCFAIYGDFKSCYEHLERCFEGIEERYGKYSLEVAYELDKISDIMVNNLEIKKNRNLIQKALEFVRRSKEIFHATLSAWDIPYNESIIANIKLKENVLLQFLDDIDKELQQ